MTERIMICRICGNKINNTPYIIREMLYGTKEEFNYFQCGNCECLQILEYPKDISKYYPKNYMAYDLKKDNFIKAYLNKKRDQSALGYKNLIGNLLIKVFGVPTYVSRLLNSSAGYKSRIVDVGCGSGSVLYRLRNAGYKNIFGIDPFIEENIKYKNGLKIYKNNLFELDGKFDLIMMNHVFEHMEDQEKVLVQIYNLLNENKYFLMCIPIINSYAWEKYGKDWIGLDAPRHYYLHSLKSLNILTDKCGFKIEKIEYDSLATQFWGSDQYKKGIGWYDENSYAVNPAKSVFTKKIIKEYEKSAFELNEKERGDRACFYLKKI